MKRKFAPALLVTAVFLVTGASAMGDVVWWEQRDENNRFDLSAFRVLVVLGNDFDYHETVNIMQRWHDWDARVEVAGTDLELTGHVLTRSDLGWDRSQTKTLTADLLVRDVDISRYHVMFFPGGGSPDSLLAADSSLVVKLIVQADAQGKVLAAICHGPRVLAVANVVQRREVTGHRDVVEELRQAGGEYVARVCVSDGNVITGNWPYFESMAVAVAERLLYPEGGAPGEHDPFAIDPVLKTIRERRSIRRFQDKDVDPATVRILLEAATWAPSPNNEQRWRFVVVRDREVKSRLVDSIMVKVKDYYESHGVPVDRMKDYWAGVFSAPVHIFAFCDDRNLEREESFEKIQLLWNMQATSLACQNILLAARALGLGSLWFGLTMVVGDEIKALLDVPEGVRFVTVIAIGYPAQEPLPPVRKPVSDVAFEEKWPKE